MQETIKGRLGYSDGKEAKCDKVIVCVKVGITLWKYNAYMPALHQDNIRGLVYF